MEKLEQFHKELGQLAEVGVIASARLSVGADAVEALAGAVSSVA